MTQPEAQGPGELLDLVDRALREPAPDLAKAIVLLERVLAFSHGELGIPARAFASPIAQLYVDWSGAPGRSRLEARLEQLRQGHVPTIEVLPRLLPNLQLPANAPGWHALRAHLVPTYGRRYTGGESLVVPVGRMPVRAMGNPFLEEIWVFAHPAGHWHFMTFGLTSLGGPVQPEPTGLDGLGFELTMRVAPAPGELGVPTWPAALLYDFAAHAKKSGTRFEVGHHMPHGRPLSGALPSALQAVGFTLDPELGRATTPHGRMSFLQLVGLTEDEEAFAAEWSSDGVFSALAESNPLHVVHRQRESMLEGPRGLDLRARAAAEGSTQEELFPQHLEFKTTGESTRLVLAPANLGVGMARNLAGLIRGRLGHGRSLTLLHRESGSQARFEPGPTEYRFEKGRLIVHLDPEQAASLAKRLDEHRGEGSLEVMPGLHFDFVEGAAN